jgi:segregation and condensation protein A
VSAFEDELRPGIAAESAVDSDPDAASECADLEQAVAEAGAGRDPGIALLLELARSGRIDPWNVDIMKVTDEYLAALDRLDPRDLARSARCIFYAAALLHLKARALAERHTLALLDSAAALDTTEGDLGDARFGLRPGDGPLLYPDADAMLTPRERRPRARGVTLLDLILALRSFDERLAAREAATLAVPAFDGEIAGDECLGITHQEDIDREKAEIRALLRIKIDGAAVDRPGAAPSVDERELASPEHPRVSVFLALLSLAADDEVVLDQESLYGPLRVRVGPAFGRPRAPEPVDSPTETLETDVTVKERT